jgi:uncharacterized protein YndB with AHSA1/START domain
MSSPFIVKGEQSVVETEISPGQVRATVLAKAPLARVWEAITRREAVSMWFGDLSMDISANKRIRLDFGDGDFFVIEGARISAPTKIEYFWRFLGTGPRDAIKWDVEDRGESCLVTVTDYEPARSEKTCLELAEGWTDFLERLEKHMQTGGLTRYDWRRDFDGSVELPVSPDEAVRILSAHRGQFIWNPWEKILRSEPVKVSGLEWKNPQCAEFQVQGANWKHATSCRLEIVPRPHACSAMIVRHTGWEGISDDSVFCMTERRRFSDKWISALKETQTLVTGTIQ